MVVSDYGCAGVVSSDDDEFQENYGAKAMSVGDLEINRPNIKRAAARTAINYGCSGVDLENDADFNDKFTDVFDKVSFVS